MNYRHTFHAGNFADVLKHFVLCLVLEKLREKESPFCVLDTHAGQGVYDLLGDAAQKTGEAEKGIFRIWGDNYPHPLLASYFDVISRQNSDPKTLRFYPGSPQIARSFMRDRDRLLLSELYPESFQALRMLFQRDRRVRVFHQDGYLSLKSLLPPTEKRGVVLIDPPFEKKDEFSRILQGLKDALSRFANGIYLVWYPVKGRETVQAFQEQVRALHPSVLAVDFYLDRANIPDRLNGSGLLVLNPPWLLEDKLRQVLPFLLDKFSSDQAGEFSISSA